VFKREVTGECPGCGALLTIPREGPLAFPATLLTLGFGIAGLAIPGLWLGAVLCYAVSRLSYPPSSWICPHCEYFHDTHPVEGRIAPLPPISGSRTGPKWRRLWPWG
jgi:hypothetical protein